MKKCLTCNAEAVENRARCAKCLKYAADYARQRSKKLRDAGLCMDCRTPTVSGVYCPKCGEKHNAATHRYYARKRSAGLCPDCSIPVSGQVMCDDCLAKYRDRRRNTTRYKLYQSIKERDGRKCRLCGKEKKLVIHHRDGQGEHDSMNRHQVANNEPSNLISLCPGCHAALTRFSHSIDKPLVIRLINSIKSVEP